MLKFKTNINCGNCVKAVTPQLSKTDGLKSWQVDTAHPDRILTVDAPGIDAQLIVQALKKAGFTAEKIA